MESNSLIGKYIFPVFVFSTIMALCMKNGRPKRGDSGPLLRRSLFITEGSEYEPSAAFFFSRDGHETLRARSTLHGIVLRNRNRVKR